MINIIVAMGKNRVIGKDNKLPWDLPEDLKRFKKLTTGHVILMGRKTFESIGKALPERTNVVITRNPESLASVPDIIIVNSLEAALDNANKETEIFVIGGAEVYKQALPKADVLHVTLISGNFEGDAYFPEIDEAEWEPVEQLAANPGGDVSPHFFWYLTYRRRR